MAALCVAASIVVVASGGVAAGTARADDAASVSDANVVGDVDEGIVVVGEGPDGVPVPDVPEGPADADEELTNVEAQEEGGSETVSEAPSSGVGEGGEVPLVEPEGSVSRSQAHVYCRAHVQSLGWKGWVRDGDVAGTTGRSLRVEALRLRISGVGGSIQASAHVQSVGWQGWRTGRCGTSGRSLRVEAVRIRLTGEAAELYDVWYRAHVQGAGWQGWVRNGKVAGTTGRSLRVEAVQVRLQPKGIGFGRLEYRLRSGVWGEWESDGSVCEAPARATSVRLRLRKAKGSVEVRARRNGSWGRWRKGSVSLRGSDAVEVRLRGRASRLYDVWYRVRGVRGGWSGWRRNGRAACAGGGVRAVQARLVPKVSGLVWVPAGTEVRAVYETRPTYERRWVEDVPAWDEEVPVGCGSTVMSDGYVIFTVIGDRERAERVAAQYVERGYIDFDNVGGVVDRVTITGHAVADSIKEESRLIGDHYSWYNGVLPDEDGNLPINVGGYVPKYDPDYETNQIEPGKHGAITYFPVYDIYEVVHHEASGHWTRVQVGTKRVQVGTRTVVVSKARWRLA